MRKVSEICYPSHQPPQEVAAVLQRIPLVVAGEVAVPVEAAVAAVVVEGAAVAVEAVAGEAAAVVGGVAVDIPDATAAERPTKR